MSNRTSVLHRQLFPWHEICFGTGNFHGSPAVPNLGSISENPPLAQPHGERRRLSAFGRPRLLDFAPLIDRLWRAGYLLVLCPVMAVVVAAWISLLEDSPVAGDGVFLATIGIVAIVTAITVNLFMTFFARPGATWTVFVLLTLALGAVVHQGRVSVLHHTPKHARSHPPGLARARVSQYLPEPEAVEELDSP